MSTLTIVPIAPPGRAKKNQKNLGYRLLFNREALRTRAVATPPTIECINGTHSIFPHDPENGGTWIAVTEHGWSFVLLETTPKGFRPIDIENLGGEPRGSLIPQLLECATVEAAGERLVNIAPPVRRPFRLLCTDGSEFVEAVAESESGRVEMTPLREPLMRTSSMLGDHVVEPPRRGLFNTIFASGGTTIEEAQDGFHHMQIPGREAIAPDMTSAEATTVSMTMIMVGGGRVELHYHGGRPRDWNDPTICVINCEDDSVAG